MRSAKKAQPARARSLIRVFANRMCLIQPPGYPKRDKWEPLPYWVDLQADLSLFWPHRSYCRFCCALLADRESSGPNVIKVFFVLNSAGHEIFSAKKYEIAENSKFSCSAMFSKKEFAIVSNLRFLSRTFFFYNLGACITKTRLYNFDPRKPHFYIVKLGFTGVYIIFFFCLKKTYIVGIR